MNIKYKAADFGLWVVVDGACVSAIIETRNGYSVSLLSECEKLKLPERSKESGSGRVNKASVGLPADLQTVSAGASITDAKNKAEELLNAV